MQKQVTLGYSAEVAADSLTISRCAAAAFWLGFYGGVLSLLMVLPANGLLQAWRTPQWAGNAAWRLIVFLPEILGVLFALLGIVAVARQRRSGLDIALFGLLASIFWPGLYGLFLLWLNAFFSGLGS